MASEIEGIIDQPSESQKRIQELAGQVKEKDSALSEAQKKAQEAQEAAAEVQRERDFYATFSDTVAANPSAKDHKDDILAKVKSGLSVEDATFAVLGKAGKLGTTVAPVVPPSPAGGSASFAPPAGGSKSVGEMTQAERREALIEAQNRGDLGIE